VCRRRRRRRVVVVVVVVAFCINFTFLLFYKELLVVKMAMMIVMVDLVGQTAAQRERTRPSW